MQLPAVRLEIRADEEAIRLLLVEPSPEYTALVRETLDRSERGRFEMRCAPHLDAAFGELRPGSYDALLLGLPPSGRDRRDQMEAACLIASQLPVIVLTGGDGDADPPVGSEVAVRERIARSRLPEEILAAVHRHRRQHGASEPVVLRDPLRGLARAFAVGPGRAPLPASARGRRSTARRSTAQRRPSR